MTSELYLKIKIQLIKEVFKILLIFDEMREIFIKIQNSNLTLGV